MAKLRANPKFHLEQSDGTPAAGWKIYTYVAGTTTAKDTYTDYAEGTPNANPVILDSRGEADIWWSGTYKVRVDDENDVTIFTVDNYGEGEAQVQTGNYNLVPNGSFELDTVTSGEPDDWTVTDYPTGGTGAGVHSLDNTDQFSGLYSLKFTSVGDGGGYATSDYFEAEEAKPVNIDWDMKSSVADVRNVVDIIWYTSAKTLISTTNLYDDSATNPTSWTAKNNVATPPSTARYAQIRVYGCHSSDATAGSTWYDNITVTGNLARKHTTNTFTKTQTWSKGADVASAAALPVLTDGNYFDVTGTTTVTSIDSLGVGTVIKLHFDGALILTHHATDLVLPGGANITTVAGDEAEFFEYASGDWRCTNYERFDGTSVLRDIGSIVQIVNVQDGSVATGTTTIPADDTIPQNTEGDEYMTLAITPTSATNKLKIDVVCNLNSTNATDKYFTAALFQDSTADALAAANSGRDPTSGGAGTIVFTHYMTSGTAISTTFKVRAGAASAGTNTFNGSGGARLFGGVMASSITITEIQV